MFQYPAMIYRKIRRRISFLRLIVILALFSLAFTWLTQVSDPAKEIIGLVVSIVLGYLGMHPINWLKHTFGISDEVALLYTWTVAAVIGVVGLYLAGQLAGFEFDLPHFFAYVGLFLEAAKFAYERFKTRQALGLA